MIARRLCVIALALSAGCRAPAYAVFDERRPVGIDEQFALLETQSGAVQVDTLPGGVVYRALPVRLVRRDPSYRWESVAGQMELVSIIGEIRRERGSRPLYAIGAESRTSRPERSAEQTQDELREQVSEEASRAETIRALRDLELEELTRASDTNIERDFLLVCIVESARDRGCWNPGERYLLRITPRDTKNSGQLDLPVWIESRNLLLSLVVGTAGVLVFLIYSTS